MATNSYFHHQNNEQDLVEDLTVEAIKIYGKDMVYLPRTLVNKDELFGEDTISKFDDGYSIEMYIESVDGFQGDGDFMSKFGLEIRDSCSLIVSKKRFKDQVGSDRPKEGDLIFLPLTNGLFEIKFVEHENPFYQVGKLFTYKLSCELFQFSQEDIDTDYSAIDNVEDDRQEFALDLVFSSSTGTFKVGETVTATDFSAVVAKWTATSRTLRVSDVTGTLSGGATVTGGTSSATGTFASQSTSDTIVPTSTTDPYDKSDEMQIEGDSIFDFTDTDPFSEGDY